MKLMLSATTNVDGIDRLCDGPEHRSADPAEEGRDGEDDDPDVGDIDPDRGGQFLVLLHRAADVAKSRIHQPVHGRECQDHQHAGGVVEREARIFHRGEIGHQRQAEDRDRSRQGIEVMPFAPLVIGRASAVSVTTWVSTSEIIAK